MGIGYARDIATRASLAVLILTTLAGGQAQTVPINSINIEGNRILGAPAILRATGLMVGDPGDSAAFDAARDRLLASGYFETIAYRFRPVRISGKIAAGVDVTFEVNETAALYPIRLEALPISIDDAVAHLKSRDPLFDGRMPGTKPALDRAAREIETLIPGQSVTGRVVALTSDRFEIEFTPARGLPAVASVEFEGSKVISAADLRNKVGEVAFGQVFSEATFRVFLENQVRPLYEAKGYMRVAFPGITTESSTKMQGLDVKVTVEEGARYRLSRVSVAGPIDSDRILRLAGIPEMNTANFDEIRAGAARVKEGLHHDGFLDAEVNYDRKPDDAARTVEAILIVEPGSEYKFGKLTVNGLDLEGEAAIRKMWAVRPGEAYPRDYAGYFASQVKKEGLFDNLGDVSANPDINRKTHIVDVTLNFKTAPPKPRSPRQFP